MSGPLIPLLTSILLQAPAAAAQDVAPPTEAPVARLTRLTDPVAKLDGRARAEQPLFHWDKVAPLRRGDGVRQGPHGLSELYFLEDRALLRCSGATHLFVGRDEAGGHVVDVRELRRFQVDARERPMTLRLPGGTELTARGAWFRVTLDPLDRRHVVRNAGPGEVFVRGPVTPVEEASVRPGHEVALPIVTDAARDRGASATLDGVRVQLGDDVRAEETARGLRLEGAGTARVRGARIHVRPGHAIHVRRPRRTTN